MPLSGSTSGPFPIEITESKGQFLVRIPPGQRDRAKGIPGRRWDSQAQKWVYPKTIVTYEALTEEFKRDATVFDIRKPASKQLPIPKPAEEDTEEALEEWQEFGDKTPGIYQKFSRLEGQIGTVLDAIQSVERSTQELLAKPQSESTGQPPQEEVIKSLSFDKPQDLTILEVSLRLLAFATSDRDQSFAKWIASQQPLFRPQAFVTETHEKLKSELGEMLGEKNHQQMKFGELVAICKEQELLSTAPRLNVIQVLYAMNQHRNRFGHPENFPEAERLARSIIYLLNLALIWPHVASEQLDEDNES